MKISEVIKELEKAKAEFGDIEFRIDDADTSWTFVPRIEDFEANDEAVTVGCDYSQTPHVDT